MRARGNKRARCRGKAAGATAYVTLEPCCHVGKTPPCTDALIQAGITHVYAACLDPNPQVSGLGIAALSAVGITVDVGLLEAEAKQLNEIFFHYMTHRTPFVIAKWAMSLDGKTITQARDDRKISNPDSHQHAHTLRQQADAILVGANTVRRDDQFLTVRNTVETLVKQPLRIVLSSRGGLPLHLNIFKPALRNGTLVVTTDAVDPAWLQQAKENQIAIFIAPKNREEQIHLPALMTELGQRGITSVLVEGGMRVHEDFFRENLVNKIHVYLAPTIIGALEKKRPLTNMQYAQLNGDHYFTADFPAQE